MRFGVLIGIVGGALDLVVGLLLLSTASMASSGAGMAFPREYAGGFLVLVLGGAVWVTTLYMQTRPMNASRPFRVPPMLVYGVLMLSLGAAMFARLFPLMQGADLSGAAMIAIGLAMVYSGARMRKT